MQLELKLSDFFASNVQVIPHFNTMVLCCIKVPVFLCSVHTFVLATVLVVYHLC